MGNDLCGNGEPCLARSCDIADLRIRRAVFRPYERKEYRKRPFEDGRRKDTTPTSSPPDTFTARSATIIMAEITVNCVPIDPYGEKRSTDAKDTPYIYLQTKVPLDSKQQNTLEGLGVKFLGRIEPNLYTCRYEHDDLEALRQHDFVDVANCYHNVWKTGPDLEQAFDSLDDPEEMSTVNIVMHNDVDSLGPLEEQIKQVEGVDADTVHTMNSVIQINAKRSALEVVKRMVEVQEVVPQIEFGLDNERAIIGEYSHKVTQC